MDIYGIFVESNVYVYVYVYLTHTRRAGWLAARWRGSFNAIHWQGDFFFCRGNGTKAEIKWID